VTPAVSIVVPTVDRHEVLARSLERLRRQNADPESFEVIVVVDAQERNPAAVADVAAGALPRARVSVAERAGASAARNVGWRAAQGPVVLFIDDDVLAAPALVSAHLRWHERHPETEVGVLGRVVWAKELRVTPFMRWLDGGVQFDYARIEGIEAGWGRFYTANVSVKRDLLDQVGGFDEDRLPFGYEDLDLAYRMSRRGFRLLYNPHAAAEHLHPMDVEFWRRRMRRVAFAEREFVRLHPEIEPYFHRMLSQAASAPQARGRGIALARWVPRWIPWLGPRVWASVDLAYKQALAPDFLEAWDEAGRGAGIPQPDLSERASGSSGGRSDSGPK
jgi:GT2 family glycosyltransferase